MARQVDRNDAQAANRGQSADARPAKSCKEGFYVGDVVYVASEYWGLMGKHPKEYDHTTRFVIVKPGLQPGCWDLCAKMHVRKQPKERVVSSLPKSVTAFVKEQMLVQTLYEDGHLGDVPALLLRLRPSPPAQRSECALYIDLTRK